MSRIDELVKKVKDNYHDLRRYLETDHGRNNKTLHRRHSKYFKNNDRELLTGTAIVAIIVILVVSIGYYYAIYSPSMQELEKEKTDKINEVNTIFKDNLSNSSTKQALLAGIDSANSVEELQRIDVESSAYPVLKNELLNQISNCSDKYHRVEVVTNGSPTIMSTSNATNYINSISTSQMVDTSINIVDTVILPVSIDREQAASGLITQGDTVDIYISSLSSDNYTEESDSEINNTTSIDDNQTNSTDLENNDTENQTNTTPATDENIDVNNSSENNSKIVGGATVVSILRSKDSGSIDSQIELSEYPTERNFSQSNTADIEEILSSKAAGTLDESQLNILLDQYGWRLSDYERTANLGDLDVEYIIMLEVPRNSVESVLNNMDNIILTIPTYDSPSWVNVTS